ncbi:MAG: 5-formyltetrahydrofolate cyclo-ligase [Opitutae bacterium]|nr:5-formyltetrahydrofolate cyclo-ligase [Opitutae bacterium]|tara:strand:- start:401 stop:1180 length:780 start_codon:yes stop_codon:yes gene_type:complete
MEDERIVDRARWKGRNSAKDILRFEVWSLLEERSVSIGPVWSRIPNFIGAEKAAHKLAELEIWKTAKIVKSNPDSPHVPVRLRALEDGKLVYVPVPELVKDYPFIELDPNILQERNISFEQVAPIKGAMEHGRKVGFQDMKPFDLAVVGSVAASRNGGRTGKGGGFADLEMGIFREMGLVNADTPIVTTIHSLQIKEDELIIMDAHDTPLDWIITPDEVIETQTLIAQPEGVNWDTIQSDQYENIPFLLSLKATLLGKK